MIIGARVDLLPPFRIFEGKRCWTAMQGDKYQVTGVTRNGKRVRRTFDNWEWAAGINLWRGSKWLVRGNRRWLITRVYNG